MKHLFVFGTRPEAIKLAPVIKTYKANGLEVFVCNTAQHRDMVAKVLEIFDIKTDYDLDIMTSNQTLNDITSRIIIGLQNVCNELKPDYIYVHGDTTTTMATSIAAFNERIKLCHIEAGLRTYNKYSPYPEEMNRVLTSKLADYHFAPTSLSRNNLIKEGISTDRIVVTGNTVIDALYMALSDSNRKIKEFGRYRFTDRKVLLVTGHRRENFGSGFENICLALKNIAEKFDSIDIVYPVHLNPNVRAPVFNILSNIPNVYLIEPLDYKPFVDLLSLSHIVLTDSGGIQEEAPSLGIPVILMRETTERPEAVDHGTVELVGTDVNRIESAVSNLLLDRSLYLKRSSVINPYGDGAASERILKYAQANFEKNDSPI